MTRMNNVLATLVAVATLTTLAAPADAFVTLKYGNDELRFSSNTVTYYLQSAGSADVSIAELEAALADAFGAWTGVSCSRLTFVYGGRRSSAPSSGVWVRFEDYSWDPTVGDAAAYAVPTSINWSGEVTAADIVFNGVDQSWTTNASLVNSGYRTDIQGVAAHEIGHTLGLTHTRVVEATMFFSAMDTVGMRTLHDDDERGVCYIYPTGSFTSGQVCDSCTDNSHCAQGDCVTYYQQPDLYCGQDCTSSSQCPDGYFCYTDNGLNTCVPDNGYCHGAGENVGMGGFCYEPEVCESGLFCLAFGGTAYCTRECGSGCPSGFTCQGTICLQAGVLELGDSCTQDFECESTQCATMAPNHYVCSQSCEDDGDCPSDFGCTWNHCFPRGDTAYGGSCSIHSDCETANCSGSGDSKYCTLSCSPGGDDCPVGAACTGFGYCSRISIDTGDACSATADCPSGDVCYYENQSDASGVCRSECDPFSGGSGCYPTMACAWGEMAWQGVVTGVCLPRNHGAALGAACTPGSDPCEWNGACGRKSGGEYECWPHCNADTNEGCTGEGEICYWLNDSSSPAHGFCYSEPVCEPSCVGRQCGGDGCGGSCGTCPADNNCVGGTCVPECVPDCRDRECGADGCGGTCGDCPAGQYCGGGGICFDDCTPDCTGRECGDDGCGGSCGTCSGSDTCRADGVCVSGCQPYCSGRQCGDDGCGGSCGECPADEYCHNDGYCLEICVPDCAGRACGDDGCGGSCGTCADDLFCRVDGVCVDECRANCTDRDCGNDGCGGSCGTCGAGEACDAYGRCVCEPQCNGRECGDDGCGGSCGVCDAGETCRADGICVCVPVCDGRQCGDDGCGGSCGTCGAAETCRVDGICVPDPACAEACDGRQCGDDGCGGTCGTCGAGQMCRVDGICVTDPSCVPACDGKQCGDNGCGGTCGTCAANETCRVDGVCVDAGGCVPACDGKLCGDDGCGGTCGTCAAGFVCSFDFECVDESTCIPNCSGRTCGNDGCGGICGNCGAGETCRVDGQCVQPASDGGGGCNAGGAPAPLAPLSFLAFLALVAIIRRRAASN